MKSKALHYGVLGAGDATANVIEDGLIDTPEDATFYVQWSPKDTGPGMDRVYEWLIDNEAPFYLVREHDSPQPPTILAGSAQGVSEVESLATWLVDNCNEVLVLWSYDEDYVALLEAAAVKGVPCRDLTNGLVPIVLMDDNPETEDPEPEEEPEAPESLTEDDIRSMPLAALRRVAKAQGTDASKMKKDEIIDLLTGAKPDQPEIVVMVITSTGEAMGTDSLNHLHTFPYLSPDMVQDIFQKVAGAKPWRHSGF
jgi:hypothetical protein